MREISCSCSISDKCPEGKLAHDRKCCILINDNDSFAKDIVREALRARDISWCRAVVEQMDMDQMAIFLKRVNELRDAEDRSF